MRTHTHTHTHSDSATQIQTSLHTINTVGRKIKHKQPFKVKPSHHVNVNHIMSVSPYTRKMYSTALEPNTPIDPTRATEGAPFRYWVQLATEKKGAGLFIVVIRCFVKRCTLLLASVKCFSVPLIHMLDATRIHRKLETERERETEEASCFIQSGPPCCDSNN